MDLNGKKLQESGRPPVPEKATGSLLAKSKSVPGTKRHSAAPSSRSGDPRKEGAQVPVVIDLTAPHSDKDAVGLNRGDVDRSSRSKAKRTASNGDTDLLFSNAKEGPQRKSSLVETGKTSSRPAVSPKPKRKEPQASGGRPSRTEKTLSRSASTSKTKRGERQGSGSSKSSGASKQHHGANGTKKLQSDKEPKKNKRTGCVVTDKRIERLLNGSPNEEQRARDLAEREALRTEKKRKPPLDLPRQPSAASRDSRKRISRFSSAVDRTCLVPENSDAMAKRKEAEVQRVLDDEERRENVARGKTKSKSASLPSKAALDIEAAQRAWRRERVEERRDHELKNNTPEQIAADNISRARRDHELRQERIAEAMMSTVARAKEKSKQEKLEAKRKADREKAAERERHLRASKASSRAGHGKSSRGAPVDAVNAQSSGSTAMQIAQRQREQEDREKEWRYQTNLRKQQRAASVIDRQRTEERARKERRLAERHQQTEDPMVEVVARGSSRQESQGSKCAEQLEQVKQARLTAAQARRQQMGEARELGGQHGAVKSGGSRRRWETADANEHGRWNGTSREVEGRARRDYADYRRREDFDYRFSRRDGEREQRRYDPYDPPRDPRRWDRGREYEPEYEREDRRRDISKESRMPPKKPYHSSNAESRKRKFEETLRDDVKPRSGNSAKPWPCEVCSCNVPGTDAAIALHVQGKRHKFNLASRSKPLHSKKRRTDANRGSPRSPKSASPS